MNKEKTFFISCALVGGMVVVVVVLLVSLLDLSGNVVGTGIEVFVGVVAVEVKEEAEDELGAVVLVIFVEALVECSSDG